MLVGVFCAGADSLADLFRTAETVNENFLTMTIDFKLAALRYEKSRIEAADELERLAAESTFLLTRSEFRRSLEDYHGEVLDSVYGAPKGSHRCQDLGSVLCGGK